MAEMGRPKKCLTKDIKSVIDDYVSFTGGTVLLNASKIAEYAETKLGIKNFKYYDITRNTETKRYVDDLNREIAKGEEKKLTSAVTTVTQINVQAYQSMSKAELGQALTNLNTLMEDMADSNTKLLREKLLLRDTIRERDIEIKKLNDTVNQTVQNSAICVADLKRTINEQREAIVRLTQSVKLKDDTLHLLWDKEAETILKQTGVFENGGVEINPQRNVTDIEESTVSVVNDAKKIESETISNKFMERLRKI
jgi:hypothetical protein